MSFKIFVAALVAGALCASSTPVAVEQTLSKRLSGQGTWFDVGLGNCGDTSSNSDWIVALPTANYAGGKHCGSQIKITSNGKTAVATVKDSCPSCSSGDLDMSPSLFKHFAGLGTGEISVSWSYV